MVGIHPERNMTGSERALSISRVIKKKMRSGQEKGKELFWLVVMSLILISSGDEKCCCVRRSRKGQMHLGSTLQLAPTLLKTTTGHVTGTISHRSSAGIRSRAGSRVLATQAGIAAVVTVNGITGTTTTDVVDGGSPAQITLEFFVEAEDGTFAAAVDVAGTATTGDEGCWDARVETSERSRTGCAARVGGLGVLQVDDIPEIGRAHV